MATKAGKRPLRALTAHEKLDAIRRVHDGESKASVARDIGVPESTLRGWCKNEDKISYLSRQSSPDTDESLEQKEAKRQKLDDGLMQPFNLSLKSATSTFSPNSENRGYSMDFIKNDTDLAKTASAAPLNLNTKPEVHKTAHMSERERNRAELARLSVELGLNRPEMFMPNFNTNSSTNNTLADLTANIGLLAQWNSILMQQQQKNFNKKSQPDNLQLNNNLGLLTTVSEAEKFNNLNMKLPKDKQLSVNDCVSYWLKTQQAMLGLNQLNQVASNIPSSTTQNQAGTVSSTATTTTTSSNAASSLEQTLGSSFWKIYKQMGYHLQLPTSNVYNSTSTTTTVADSKPILYQQLTKDKEPHHNAENIPAEEPKTNSKVRSVLDNLLYNNNNISSTDLDNKDDSNATTNKDEQQSNLEAVQHGEKFLKWLETCSNPSVTAMQIMQFRTLLNNVKTGSERKNGDLPNKAKVKRK